MLFFIGLGLYDEHDLSVKGLEHIRRADHIFLESYTSCLTGTSLRKMERLFGREIQALNREDVEQHPETFLALAKEEDVAFLTGGDPMVSTTHTDLRIRAAAMGVQSRIIHGASIASAVCGLTGLQNYRFGKSCSVPYPEKGWFPTAPFDVIASNLDANLHTLIYLDIRENRHMTIPEAITLIREMAEKRGAEPPDLYVGVARAGSAEPSVAAGTSRSLIEFDFGPPLHILVVPADLHMMEREYLETFAGL